MVFLFKADEYTGSVVSSEEGQMEWVERSRLPEINTVEDFDALLKVVESPELSELQYIVDGNEWIVSIK